MANYLYVRVSSKDQNTDRQLADVDKLNIPDLKVYMDKCSGKDFNRPEYQRMLAELKENDVVYFHSIDRMGRNYDEILENWKIITKDIKADIIILDMPLLNTSVQGKDLTGKLIADIVLQLLSYVAQKERESIKVRQAEGIEIARKDGKYRQTEASEEKILETMKRYVAGEITVSQGIREIGYKSRRSWYYRLERFKRDGLI